MRLTHIGEWRSLVAHALGVGGVAGSNPVSPIYQQKATFLVAFFVLSKIGLFRLTTNGEEERTS